jgi:phosphatidylserine/phosphatidylglycerophosphate/cardiolipin synthase-like enzyme
MKLIVQPDDGTASLLQGIESAAQSIEIAIFRLDHVEVKRALERAVSRGVSVHALIADTNHGNEKDLRKLETELLAGGIEVSRTAHDLLRHHYKFLVIDARILYLLTFNFTYLDMADTRSFGLIIDDIAIVTEARTLFHSDIRRQPYRPAIPNVLVSPINARQEMSRFLRGADEQLLIYNPEVTDRAILDVLRERARKGVDIRIIGRVAKSADFGASRRLRTRFRTRAIVRDGRAAFLGSQSLRERELDRRRELGLIVEQPDVVGMLASVFEEDWRSAVSESKSIAVAALRPLPRAAEARLRRQVASAIQDAVSGMMSHGTTIQS